VSDYKVPQNSETASNMDRNKVDLHFIIRLLNVLRIVEVNLVRQFLDEIVNYWLDLIDLFVLMLVVYGTRCLKVTDAT